MQDVHTQVQAQARPGQARRIISVQILSPTLFPMCACLSASDIPVCGLTNVINQLTGLHSRSALCGAGTVFGYLQLSDVYQSGCGSTNKEYLYFFH